MNKTDQEVFLELCEDTTQFNRCVNFSAEGDEMTVECKLGLWSVSGYNVARTIVEADHYWRQYKEDGEYWEILGGVSPFDKLMER